MRTLLYDARRGHAGLYWIAAGTAALALVTAGLALVDPRTLVGAPLWFKPMKFSISIALFALALAWMLGQLRERALRRTGWAIVAGLVLEMVIIVGQAARGQKSHYNTDDLLGGILFSIMGATITVVWFLTLAVALRFLREPGRHTTASLPGVNIPIEITFTPCACGGMIMFSTLVGRFAVPSMRGTEWP